MNNNLTSSGQFSINWNILGQTGPPPRRGFRAGSEQDKHSSPSTQPCTQEAVAWGRERPRMEQAQREDPPALPEAVTLGELPRVFLPVKMLGFKLPFCRPQACNPEARGSISVSSATEWEGRGGSRRGCEEEEGTCGFSAEELGRSELLSFILGY